MCLVVAQPASAAGDLGVQTTHSISPAGLGIQGECSTNWHGLSQYPLNPWSEDRCNLVIPAGQTITTTRRYRTCAPKRERQSVVRGVVHRRVLGVRGGVHRQRRRSELPSGAGSLESCVGQQQLGLRVGRALLPRVVARDGRSRGVGALRREHERRFFKFSVLGDVLDERALRPVRSAGRGAHDFDDVRRSDAAALAHNVLDGGQRHECRTVLADADYRAVAAVRGGDVLHVAAALDEHGRLDHGAHDRRGHRNGQGASGDDYRADNSVGHHTHADRIGAVAAVCSRPRASRYGTSGIPLLAEFGACSGTRYGGL